jgi:protein-L-isoaspartate(D-aspartate) O-methyltransferase
MSFSALAASATPSNTEFARQQMIDQQIRAWSILDSAVLGTLSALRREDFVPPVYRPVAFADAEIPLGHDQVMLSPKIDGKILQALELKNADRVLDVGSGSGYLAACMGKLAGLVRSIEFHADLAEQARRNCLAAAANNVAIEVGDFFQLAAQLEDQQFDAIAISGAMPIYDDRLQRVLKIGGRMVLFLGTAPVMQAIKITRTTNIGYKRETLFETVVPSLINAPQPPKFVF